MKVTLTKVSRKNTDKFGAQLVSKTGKPYTRLSIQTSVHADRWLSGFDNAQTKDWTEGKEVEIEVVESQTKDREGRPYLNFNVPRPGVIGKEEFEALKMRVEILEKQLLPAGPASTGSTLPPEEEINVDDIPF